jgi:hypothetical protein
MKEAYCLFAVIAAVILAGCQGGTNTPSKAQPFIGGTEGINVVFAADSPPAEVDDGGNFPFDVVVELRNKGENTVLKDDVTVKIVGVRPEEFAKTESDLSKHPEEDVIATKKDPEGAVTEGPPVFVTFSDFNHKTALVGNQDFTLRAEACYVYKTTATAQLCVRRNNIDPEKNGLCDVSGDKTVENSGSPIQVTAFKEFGRAKDKVGFQFTIEHQGKGDLFEKKSQCNTERKYEDKIFVKVKSQFGSGLKCSGLTDGDDTSGYIKLYGESRIISCTQQVTTNSDYETSIDIELEYDYRDTTETAVLVKHIPQD